MHMGRLPGTNLYRDLKTYRGEPLSIAVYFLRAALVVKLKRDLILWQIIVVPTPPPRLVACLVSVAVLLLRHARGIKFKTMHFYVVEGVVHEP